MKRENEREEGGQEERRKERIGETYVIEVGVAT